MNGRIDPDGWAYDVRPADPAHQREHPDATEVVIYFNGKMQRVHGVFETARIATQIAGVLNQFVGKQIR